MIECALMYNSLKHPRQYFRHASHTLTCPKEKNTNTANKREVAKMLNRRCHCEQQEEFKMPSDECEATISWAERVLLCQTEPDTWLIVLYIYPAFCTHTSFPAWTADNTMVFWSMFLSQSTLACIKQLISDGVQPLKQSRVPHNKASKLTRKNFSKGRQAIGWTSF